ncbi:hypothetical protein Pelo_7170 [Pelomyxa schiedti]|nr:hypothetical protein Pelo_7170 [Pelomyxa schiedti]
MATAEGPPATPSGMSRCVTEEKYFGPPRSVLGSGTVALTMSVDMGVWTQQQARNLTWYHNSKNCSAEAFRLAASSWEAACGATFVQVFDPSKALFDVVDATYEQESDPRLANVIAMAFFPRQAPPHHVVCFAVMQREGTRNIAIAVLRHELGHVLGWRHEHMWDQSPESRSLYFPDSQGNWIRELPDANCRQLTVYDRQSIMNYLKIWEDQRAGIVTDLSENDKLGSSMMYPKSEYSPWSYNGLTSPATPNTLRDGVPSATTFFSPQYSAVQLQQTLPQTQTNQTTGGIPTQALPYPPSQPPQQQMMGGTPMTYQNIQGTPPQQQQPFQGAPMQAHPQQQQAFQNSQVQGQTQPQQQQPTYQIPQMQQFQMQQQNQPPLLFPIPQVQPLACSGMPCAQSYQGGLTMPPMMGSQPPQLQATQAMGGSITSAVVLAELAEASLLAMGVNASPDQAVIAKATELNRMGAFPNIVNNEVMSGSMFCVIGLLAGLLPHELIAMLKSRFPNLDPSTILNDVSTKMKSTKHMQMYQGVINFKQSLQVPSMQPQQPAVATPPGPTPTAPKPTPQVQPPATLADRLKVSSPSYLDQQLLKGSEQNLIGKDMCFVSKKYTAGGHHHGFFYAYQLLVKGDSDPPLFLDKDICHTLTSDEPPSGPHFISGKCTEINRMVAQDKNRFGIATGKPFFVIKIS